MPFAECPCKVISRSSRLARVQTDEAIATLQQIWPDAEFVVQVQESPGDRDMTTSLTDPTLPDDFFTRDLDEQIATGEADLAVHSAKDVPRSLRNECVVAAWLPAAEIRDALVFPADWPQGKSPQIIGTSSPARVEQIRTLYPDAVAKPIRGDILSRLQQLDAGEYDAVIIAACALERLGLGQRISSYLPYDPAPLQGRLAIVVHRDRNDLIRALRSVDVRHTAGLVAIIGCPADPALLAARAWKYMEHADVVIHDRLLPDPVLNKIRHKAIAVGKTGGQASIPQSDIHRLMLMEAEQGKLVVRLQGGDPLIFAHLSEELDFLSAWQIRIDLVPALTAAQVAAAHALAPLTHRDDGGHLHVIAGHTPAGEQPMPMPGPGQGNLAIYMGVREAGPIAERLTSAGWSNDTSLIVGERIGYSDEAVRPIQLGKLGSADIKQPAVFLVGPASYPAAVRTLFTGTDPDHFLKYGPLIHWPMLELVSQPLPERCAVLQRRWSDVDGVLFPSRFAVHSFMEALLEWADVRTLAGKKILAVGPSTAAELRQFGIRADAAVDHYGGLQSLVNDMQGETGGHYLYPCSSVAPRPERLATLANVGLTAVAEVFYRNQPPAHRPLPGTEFGRVLFTSGSTVNAYFKHYPEEREAQRDWLAVGPSTSKALIQLGLDPEELPKPNSDPHG